VKIICIGRNYKAHAAELNNTVPENPLFFLKPDTALLAKKMPFFIPDFSDQVHHEVEVVVKINRVGKHIEERFAHKYYQELSLGIDFTARDVQQKCKEQGLPWEIAKSFDGAAPVGTFISKESVHLESMPFSLKKNGQLVQEGNTQDMLFSIDKIIAYISTFITLKKGDLIFTGTPAGVSRVQKGDQLEAYISENSLLKVSIR